MIMKLSRIFALILRDFTLMRRSKFMVTEYFYFPLVTTLTWGFFVLAAPEAAVEASLLVFVANIMMSLNTSAQSTVNLTMMDDSWSGSFLGLMLSGISEAEYLVARICSSIIVSLGLTTSLLAIAYGVFGVTFIGTQLPAILLLIGLSLAAAIGFAVVLGGIILALGKEFGFLAWSALVLFILLSAPLFPVETFPAGLKEISAVMPFTGAFEGLRELVATGALGMGNLIHQVIVTAAYLIVGFPVYFGIFRYARRTGRLIRMSW